MKHVESESEDKKLNGKFNVYSSEVKGKEVFD